MQAEAEALPAPQLKAIRERSESVGNQLDFDEADTRAFIDGQLRRGVRPQKNKNLAISEWPTDNGPADYARFIGEYSPFEGPFQATPWKFT